MSRRLALTVTERAAHQIERAADWWQVNRRKAPDAVFEELLRVFEFITRQPEAGLRQSHPTLPGLRRIYLSRIRMYLYYRFIRNMTAPPSSRFSRCGTGVGIHVHRYSELTPNRRVNLTGCARSLLGGRRG